MDNLIWNIHLHQVKSTNI